MLVEQLLEGLNPAQREIVKDTEGYLLVLAGAGSGKTRVLTHRIAYLIGPCQVKPWQILAVTFTNKASREMKARIVSLTGNEGHDVWIGTFHGICIRILSRFGSEIGVERFTIIDDADQKKILKEVVSVLGSDKEIDVIKGEISNYKNALKTPAEVLESANNDFDKEIAHLYQAYEDEKDKNNYLDYDDCIMKTVHLFNVSEKARDHYQHQFRYVLTDETQDTNKAQFTLLQQLSAHHENLFAVGDADQSIYRWRGAEVGNIINFKNIFPGAKTYLLEQNYRSTSTIVNASNAVVKHNKYRLEKTAFTEAETGEPIMVYQADDDGREADFVTQVIRRLQYSEKRKWSDFAVLYRTNRQSREVEKALKQFGVPYQLVGGHAFYDRKEIKDLVAYLRAVDNGVDALAFNRIINVPKRGIGDSTIAKIQDYANECGIPFPKALVNIDDIPKIPKKALGSIKEFVSMMNKFDEFTRDNDFSVPELIRFIIRETNYMSTLNLDKEEDVSRYENIQELINMAGKWAEETESETKSLTEFLIETTLMNDVDSMEDTEMVTLMSTHAAKGLEFPVVFIVGLEETIFPHGRSMDDPMQMEEERRLMYVAMTRAEKRLFLTHCRQRYEYGNPRPTFNRPSRFLREIPQMYVKRV